MNQRLHLVFGGELVSPEKAVFKDVGALHVVGIYPNYQAAVAAWKSEAQRTVDNAHMRYFIADLHDLRQDDGTPGDDGKPDALTGQASR
jgi:hypothetical protein